MAAGRIYIISLNSTDTSDITEKLMELDDNLTLASKFTTNESNNVNTVTIDPQTLFLAYKNNSIFYTHASVEETFGVFIDDYYNSNLFEINIEDFNIISNNFFNEDDIIVWIDNTGNKSDNIKNDINEINILWEKLNLFPYLYFYNEKLEVICEIILNYIYGSEEDKKELLEEYS